MINSTFRHRYSATSESLSFLIEKLRPNTKQEFETFTQSLFERATRDSEQQVAQALRLPFETSEALLARNRIHNRRFESRRNCVEREALVRRYCAGFEITRREEYLDLLQNDDRSRVIVSFHLGDFLFGSASLLSLDGNRRRNYVVSLNRSGRACFANLAAGFEHGAPRPSNELLLGETSSSQLSQLLRGGNASIVLFCDLPLGLNETTEVNFLSRRASFSIGPALLALANRVPVLPIINYTEAGTSHVLIGDQVEPVLLRSEALRSGAQRITQHLIAFFEKIFLAHPEQWRFLSLLPSYFCNPSSRAHPIHREGLAPVQLRTEA